MVGNIGTGKSLISSKFAKRGEVVVNMDSITSMMGGGEYGLYDRNKKEIYRITEIAAIEGALLAGFNVVVDRTNMDRKRRAPYIELAKKYNAEIICYDFGVGSFATFSRRVKESYGIPAGQWRDVHNIMESLYEAPSFDEGFNIIQPGPDRYEIHAIDFDGTIVENKYPYIGEIRKQKYVDMMMLWEDLTKIIIIWTCRTGDQLNEMRKFLIKNNIPFDFINENPLFPEGGRKIFAHKYHDDRNVPV